jgi:hypothetical protein
MYWYRSAPCFAPCVMLHDVTCLSAHSSPSDLEVRRRYQCARMTQEMEDFFQRGSDNEQGHAADGCE